MNLNRSTRFSQAITNVNLKRSMFDMSHGVKTTFNAGELVPIDWTEILPGDTFNQDTKFVVRMSNPPVTPTMDCAYIEYAWWFVPMRLVWKHTKEFFGENTTTHWEQPTEYEIPQINPPEGGWAKGTIADYLGINPGIKHKSVNSLVFRGYAKIWNEFYRDQNLQDPAYINDDETTLTGSNGGTYQTDAQLGGKCLPVAKYHDYFTSCLPEPQKGPNVLLPLGDSANVIGQLGFKSTNDNKYIDIAAPDNSGTVHTYRNGQQVGNIFNIVGDTNNKNSNLKADLSTATASTISQLRQAFQVQKFYERDARGGTRYTEIINSHFGVISPDARQQRPEYLGGKRVPINISQVLQTSETTEKSAQGNVAAYSHTQSKNHDFVKSFTEHGFLYCLVNVRTEHTYQQGIDRAFSRKRKFDFYWPEFANLSEQTVLNKEIYSQGTDEDDEGFGFQEPYAEYRYKPNRISGAFRSTYAQSLDSYHYADKFDSLPTLSDTFIRETKNNIDRTLSVGSEVEDQFIADFWFPTIATRTMPMYGIPGFMDHN